LAAIIFCGGTAEAAKALLFVRALFLAWLPRNPHTPGSGARGTHRDIPCSEVHQDLIVSKNAAFYKAFWCITLKLDRKL
jgi:hypothetical protein